ncbi:hypothetical protein RJ639_005275 [Escallonia herrerae]|uniref:RING-type E3 ubiquitin transferase n=1 Tax=Escallonia herrerae TaxID=1293975 RepID=A0AA88W3W3_9ASTE|nr:hypothetical protein RJ639_005275 [Escallonia herrerae]
MPRFYAPPPLLTIVGGTATTTIQPQLYYNGDTPQNRPPSSASSSSVMIVVIIIASAIIVSASLYLLLRFLSRRFHRSFRTFSAADDVVSSRNLRCINDQNGQTNELFDSLPLFTFGSVTGNATGGDCAVCLSKFESNDQLRLLPLCCHAFHSDCIDTWLAANQTCPLCRSTVHPTEADVSNKLVPELEAGILGNSFRIEIGSVSQRRAPSESGRRSYSIGSFDYIVDEGYEVSVGSTHRRGASDCTEKDSAGAPVSQHEPPGEILAEEVAGGRSWLRDYVDRISAISVSSRAMSFRSTGRFFTGSSRRSENAVVAAAEDVEANRVGEEISELFRWLSGV